MAGLWYFLPNGPGIRRRRVGKGFSYVDPHGEPVRDGATLERIRLLVIPPAWSSVWISPNPNTHIQAVGRDARGRKQYRYHSEYRKVRDLVKFDRMRAFGRALPRIRRIVTRDLARQGLPKRKVLAAVVRLLETTFMRIGNEEYAEENGSFGLTTLRNQHVQILGEMLKFKFRGKSGQNHEVLLEDRRLSRIVRKCRDIPGSALFQYLDNEGHRQTLDSGDVNAYVREISRGEFTAKDFRTWGGTCLAASFLLAKCAECSDGPSKTALVEVVKEVGTKLGNKPAVCKKYYIHPAVMDCYSAGKLFSLAARVRDSGGNHISERVVLAVLRTAKAA
ncbi:MAG: DNA topoisomerase IB [Acidobacteriaceae bacterium]|nr:DNA topoisomerase IB [Acidobacteriaceae bacterium]